MQLQTPRESRAPFAEWLARAFPAAPGAATLRELFHWYLEGFAPLEAVEAMRVERRGFEA